MNENTVDRICVLTHPKATLRRNKVTQKKRNNPPPCWSLDVQTVSSSLLLFVSSSPPGKRSHLMRRPCLSMLIFSYWTALPTTNRRDNTVMCLASHRHRRWRSGFWAPAAASIAAAGAKTKRGPAPPSRGWNGNDSFASPQESQKFTLTFCASRQQWSRPHSGFTALRLQGVLSFTAVVL